MERKLNKRSEKGKLNKVLKMFCIKHFITIWVERGEWDIKMIIKFGFCIISKLFRLRSNLSASALRRKINFIHDLGLNISWYHVRPHPIIVSFLSIIGLATALPSNQVLVVIYLHTEKRTAIGGHSLTTIDEIMFGLSLTWCIPCYLFIIRANFFIDVLHSMKERI